MGCNVETRNQGGRVGDCSIDARCKRRDAVLRGTATTVRIDFRIGRLARTKMRYWRRDGAGGTIATTGKRTLVFIFSRGSIPRRWRRVTEFVGRSTRDEAICSHGDEDEAFLNGCCEASGGSFDDQFAEGEGRFVFMAENNVTSVCIGAVNAPVISEHIVWHIFSSCPCDVGVQ